MLRRLSVRELELGLQPHQRAPPTVQNPGQRLLLAQNLRQRAGRSCPGVPWQFWLHVVVREFRQARATRTTSTPAPTTARADLSFRARQAVLLQPWNAPRRHRELRL